jgi:murein L,D-transpeptidase YcbB/YkuD
MLPSIVSRVSRPARVTLPSMRSVALAVLAASLMAAPALSQTLAQSGVPTPKAKAKSHATTKSTKSTKTAKKSLPAATRISNSPHPTYDEDTARRIAAAMLSYSTLEVRGGWPTLPADVVSLAPGSSGPQVALLRERLAITDDLPPQQADGDVFDANLTAAIKRFQSRHGLEQTGTVGQRACASLRRPSTGSPPWISFSASAMWS